MSRRRHHLPQRVVLFALTLSSIPATASDGIELAVSKSANETIQLRWSSGIPAYHIYRSDSPIRLESDANRIATSYEYALSDQPPAGQVIYYQVSSRGECYQPIADTYVRAETPSRNFANEQYLRAISGLGTTEILFRFQLDQIASGAIVDSAILTMWEESTGGFALDLRPVESAWTEGDVTWNKKPLLGATESALNWGGGSGRRSWEVTSLVREWVGGQRSNHGMGLSGSSGSSFSIRFSSSRATEDRAPRLCVQWRDPVREAADRLLQRSTIAPSIRYSGDRAEFVEARVARTSQDPVEAALTYLVEFGAMHGLSNPRSELFLDRRGSRNETDTITFGRRHQGVRVLREAITVRLDATAVRSVSAKLDASDEFVGTFAMTTFAVELKALANAGQVLATRRVIGTAMPVWFRSSAQDSTPARAAYLVAVSGREINSGIVRWIDYYLDAENGTTIQTRERQVTGDRPGESFIVETVNNTDSDTCWSLPWETDDDTWFDDDGPDGYPGSDAFSDAPDAASAIHTTYHYFFDRFGLRSWDGLGEMIEADVHWQSPSGPNARFSRSCDLMAFSDGWGQLDIVAHEFTHGLVHHFPDLEYENQSGALNESLADTFAAFIDGNWLVGEGREDAPGPFRNMQTPSLFDDPDHIDPARSGDELGLRTLAPGTDPDETNDDGFVHTNSGIPNKVAFLTTDGGWHNGFTITGLGQAKAERLYIQALLGGFDCETDLLGARDVLVSQARRDRDLGVLTVVDVCSVINAWASVGLGNPDTDCDGSPNLPTDDGDGDGYSDGADNCPTVATFAMSDLDGDGLGDACDIDLDGDLINNDIDNCPRTMNVLQRDSDGDGIGDSCDDGDRDGVLDVVDNCPTWNPGQEDLDGDDTGDSCDDDKDGDGVDNGSDNCDRVSNPGQADEDGDSVGNVCDNCFDEPNPLQEDLDRDNIGDLCDDDVDGDGWLNAGDNCASVHNADQFDTDLDGVGTLCDLDELSHFDGLSQAKELSLFLKHQNIGEAMRLPIRPCHGPDCPSVLPERLRVDVDLSLQKPYLARVINDRGDAVATARFDPQGQYLLQFYADQQYSYKSSIDSPAFSARQYFLELWAPPGSQSGQTLTGLIDVRSVVEP